MSQTFTVRVERDLESGWLVGKVLELPGCYTQARDLESLRTNIVEAIEVYRESVGPGRHLDTEFVDTFEIAIPA